jgi:nicotinamide-nucleotide amidase
LIPRTELICVGTELLMGKPNAHGPYLARRLGEAGLALHRETTVADDPADMEAAFREAWRRADVVLATGGLGPTFDDITREAWSRVLRRPLRFDPSLARGIAARFRRRGLAMPKENRRQAYVLAGARALPNPHGTAPGQILEMRGKLLFLFPGPAREFQPMAEQFLFPALMEKFPRGVRRAASFRLFGRPESWVDERIRPLVDQETSGRGVEVVWGILAQGHVVEVKVTVGAASSEAVQRRLNKISAALRTRLGAWIYGEGDLRMEEVLGSLLRARGETLSLAESCTGGLLAGKITSVAGSSDYFKGGFVTYHNDVKRDFLGVQSATLKKHGAVSAPCAEEMAAGCRRRAGTTWALSVTGVAGPGGGSPEKPVGLVFAGLAGPAGTRSFKRLFFGDRAQIREQSALWALDLLRRQLIKNN